MCTTSSSDGQNGWGTRRFYTQVDWDEVRHNNAYDYQSSADSDTSDRNSASSMPVNFQFGTRGASVGGSLPTSTKGINFHQFDEGWWDGAADRRAYLDTLSSAHWRASWPETYRPNWSQYEQTQVHTSLVEKPAATFQPPMASWHMVYAWHAGCRVNFGGC